MFSMTRNLIRNIKKWYFKFLIDEVPIIEKPINFQLFFMNKGKWFWSIFIIQWNNKVEGFNCLTNRQKWQLSVILCWKNHRVWRIEEN